MKNHFFVASAFLLAAPALVLISGCGGGGSLLPTPTPTSIAFPTPTNLPANTPLPTPTQDSTPTAVLVVTSESNDGSTFGPVRFHSENGVASQTSSSYTVTFHDTDYPYRSIRVIIPNPKTISIGKTYQLASSEATMVATSTPAGAVTPISWGGPGHSQGRLQVVGFGGGLSQFRYDFELQDVVLTRQPSKVVPNPGQSQLKISNAFSTYININ